MKTVAFTALLGALFALPFVLGRRKHGLIPVQQGRTGKTGEFELNQLYDIDDFVTE